MITRTQGYFDKVASRLLYFGLVVTYVLTWGGKPEALLSQTTTGLLFILGTLVLKLLHYHFVGQGNRWAKGLLVGLFVLGLVLLAVDTKRMLAGLNTPMKIVNYSVTQLVQLGAIALVFRYKFTKAQG